MISSDFAGRVVQLTDALDRHDAVSNQVFSIDLMLKNIGLKAIISSRFVHPDIEDRRVSRDSLKLECKDILIVHYYGYSEGLCEWLDDQYCTKILVYHNITPHSFFLPDTTAYKLCKDGRDQLKELVGRFQAWWGDSDYNIQELIELGADPAKSAVLPIVVDTAVNAAAPCSCKLGQWIFVGRVAASKGIVELIDLFAASYRNDPEIARALVVVGGFHQDDPYYSKVKAAIARSGVQQLITLTGKIPDEDRDRLIRESSVYVSLSEHEGFGVPLVEASNLGVPVVALDRGAVAETLAGIGVFRDIEALATGVVKLAQDGAFRASSIALQQSNARRFRRETAEVTILQLLKPFVPERTRYRTLSVVVCTYNRRDYLERCLEYLTFQSNDSFEVIVVDGPSDDGSAELIESYRGRIKIARNPERNLSKSRNIGIDLAAGDIVAFIDDDALPFDDWVDQVLRAYNQRPLTVAGLGGPAYYAGTFWFQAEDNGINSDCQAKVNISSDEIGKQGWKRYNTGTNATFVRSYLEAVDGFDEQYDYYLDEAELCYRLQESGYLIDYVPDIYVRHEFAQSHNRGGRMNYNWHTICKNTAYFLATHGSLQGAALRKSIDSRMKAERIKPLNDAVKEGQLSAEACVRYIDDINNGVTQGLEDAKSWPRTRSLAPRPNDFLRYHTRHDRIAVGRDIAPLHVCIVSREAPPFAGSGGVGTLYYHLASELLLMGHKVSFVVPGGEDKVHRQGRLTVYFTQAKNYRLPPLAGGLTGNIEWSATALSRLAEIHKDQKIDVVDSALWDTEALAYSLIERQHRPPLVVRLVTPYAVSAEHNGWNPPPEQLAMFMEAERALVREADAIIPISNTIADTMTGKYGLHRDRRWSVGHCGIAHWPSFDVNEGYDEFPELDGVDGARLSRSKLVLFVGRLERRKGIDLINEATEAILRADPDAFLILAGRDPEGWGQRIRERLGAKLGERFAALGEVTNATREKLLAHAFCLLFPSRYESFGLVPLEAFVHGTPVIAARAGAIPEVVLEGESGILIDPDSPQELANAVVELMRNPEMHQQLSLGAKARVRQLSARNSALHTLEVYARTLRN